MTNASVATRRSGQSQPQLQRIPFNCATRVHAEEEYVLQALRSGSTSGDSSFTRRCHAVLAETLGVGKVLLTTSCTHALEMAAILLRIEPGDEVIVPSYTFVSTANAFVLRGARPIFADVRPDTLNLDEVRLEALITPRTRAIVPVHYAGVACNMDAILGIAARHGIAVVEDNAHGLFGTYREKPLGSFGALATQSFHATKNFSCGEGGALIVNDPALRERAEVVREKGTNRSQFLRGDVDRYGWNDIGSSYLLSDVLAAVLLAQVERWQDVQRARGAVWERYHLELRDWAREHDVRQPVIPADCGQAFQMYYLLLPSTDERERFAAYLSDNGIETASHYPPLHLSKMGRKLGGKPGSCPVCEDVSGRLLRLPFYTGLAEPAQGRVINAVTRYKPGTSTQSPPSGHGFDRR